jgi:hypothetical protein
MTLMRFCSGDSSGRPWRVIYMCEIVGKGTPRFTPAAGPATRTTKEKSDGTRLSRDESESIAMQTCFFCLGFFLFRVDADSDEDDVGSHGAGRQ